MGSSGRRKVLAGAFLAGVALVVSAIVLDMVVFPAAIRSRILESVQLQRGSDALKRFIRLPQPVHLKVYFFNVTNPDEVHAGTDAPTLRQLGPYVYDLYKEKVEVEEDFSTDTLSFYQKSQYFFNTELSIGGEDDPITVLNVPMLGIIDQAAKSSATLLPFVSVALPDMFSEAEDSTDKSRVFTPFMTTTVGRLLFHGVRIKCSRKTILRGFIKSLVCSGLASNLPTSIRRAEEEEDGTKYGDFLFSFMHYKNNSREGPFVVRRGLKNPESVGQVVTWQGLSEVHAWGPPPPETSPCNQIRGTDSSVFPPFLNEKTVIRVFQAEMCRTVSASFEKRVEYKKIPGIRYVADTNLFDTPDHNPDNWCFYPSGDEKSRQRYWSSVESGVQDLSSCLGAPLIVSYPHFYAASRSYLNYAKGLHPEKRLHETYLILEPMTGSPLTAARRLQFNMYLRRVNKISFLRNVPEGLFPIMWAEEGMNLDDKFSNMLSEGLVDVIHLLDIIKWTIIALGLFEMIAVLIFARGRWNESGDAADQKMKEANQLPTYEMSKTTSPSGIGDCNG